MTAQKVLKSYVIFYELLAKKKQFNQEFIYLYVHHIAYKDNLLL